MRSWDILENAADGGRAAAEAGGQPGSQRALAAVRDTVDEIYGRYLQRHGKRRWCDKSLGSHQQAGLARRLYPDAKFICLYRHCMDVIAAGVAACPWGLHRFGYDDFTTHSPGNSVTAIGSYWLSCVQSIMAFERQHPDACHRVRYEDLVTAPDSVATAMFSFLGEVPVPDIGRACLQTAHEANGPGDEEIWFTSAISADSVGTGIRVPAAALTPQLRQGVNVALERLGYRTVDEDWNALAGRIDMRADAAEDRRSGHGQGPGRAEDAREMARAVGDRLRAVTARQLREVCAVWPAVSGGCVAIVVEDVSGAHAEVRWSFATPMGLDCGTTRQPVCTMIAGTATWHDLLTGQANLIAELTAGRLRCVNRRDGHRIRSAELHAISWLLGLARVPVLRAPYAAVPGAAAAS